MEKSFKMFQLIMVLMALFRLELLLFCFFFDEILHWKVVVVNKPPSLSYDLLVRWLMWLNDELLFILLLHK